MNYQQLTEDERYQIYELLKDQYSITAIASALGRHKSTISREVRRNTGGRGYRPKQAHVLCHQRRSQARKYIKLTPAIANYIEEKLALKWSPDQISQILKEEHQTSISIERIYQFIAKDKLQGGSLYLNLRHGKKRRKKRCGQPERRGSIKNRVGIEHRPAIVNERSRIGDWELDTMIGKNHQGVLVTIVERYSLKTLIKKLDSKHSCAVTNACIEKLKPYKKHTHTATSDNGREFAGHEQIARELGLDFFFATPYASWERGSNENTNGLIRQYVPKGTCISDYSDEYIQRVEDELNNRPRRVLGYRTPNEIFAACQ